MRNVQTVLKPLQKLDEDGAIIGYRWPYLSILLEVCKWITEFDRMIRLYVFGGLQKASSAARA